MFSWKKRGSEDTKKWYITNANRFEDTNSFETLNKEIECYKCNNFGHSAEECKSNWTAFVKGTDYHHEKCRIASQAQDKSEQWCVDSGCSKHMTGDKSKFITLDKNKIGTVKFGNDKSANIIGKGVVNLGTKKGKVENVLLIEDMTHNLLSVSQICDHGHICIFDST